LSLICHSEVRDRFRGRVVDLEKVRVERLAVEIADQLVAGQGSVLHLTDGLGDVDRWRRAARRAGRILSVPVRTGVSPDGTRVWAVDES
jgi:hypothetical protein